MDHEPLPRFCKDKAFLGKLVESVSLEQLCQLWLYRTIIKNAQAISETLHPNRWGWTTGVGGGWGSQVTLVCCQVLAFLFLSPRSSRQTKNFGRLEKAQLVSWGAWGLEGSLETLMRSFIGARTRTGLVWGENQRMTRTAAGGSCTATSCRVNVLRRGSQMPMFSKGSVRELFRKEFHFKKMSKDHKNCVSGTCKSKC